ncbi:MAG: cytosine permease [Propionibacteriaceae bacterium]|nr:cytosine permease [Propionibacteriaceae bacterium]
MTTTTSPATESNVSVFTIEENGIDVIPEAERKGKASSLFWPWFAANISVFAVSYGSWILGYGLSFWQATIAALVGTILSFLLVGAVSLAGKRGSAPTMVLSRAAFGVKGNVAPGILSWILLVGWETVLVILATLAAETVIGILAPGVDGNLVKIIAFIIVLAIIVGAGIIGYDLIMKIQTVLTIVCAVVTLGYLILAAGQIDLSQIGNLSNGSWSSLLGATVMVMTALGLGWVNSAADYSRYLPRRTSSGKVLWWTTFGSSIGPIILIVFGLLLVASQPEGAGSTLAGDLGANPIGALAAVLPLWYLIPFIIVAVGGLASGAVLDIYSSGLTLLTIGLPVKRWVGSLIDGIIMLVGTIAVVWFADDFLTPFQAFLGLVGTPIAAWVGIFLGDMVLRRRDYDDAALFDAKGRYGSVNWLAVITMLVLTAIGWGFTASDISWLGWLGYLFPLFGLDAGAYGYSGFGVLIAIVVAFLVTVIASRGRIRRQEASQLG